MISFKTYLANLARANELTGPQREQNRPESGTENPEWLFYPGMLQDSYSKWWSDFGTRATCHEGIDICFYRIGRGSVTPLLPGAKVPAMARGTVLNISADLLGKSIVVSWSEEEKIQVVLVYSHLDVAAGLSPGDTVDSNSVIGRTFDTRTKQSKLRSHLHISCICLPKGLAAQEMNWDLFADRTRVFHLNPIFIGRDDLDEKSRIARV